MHITSLIIRNFRALEDIQCEFTSRVNVIVGPNAVGKTTILQAIRLVKALLAPRTSQEAQNTLVSLGAASPHFQQRLFLDAIMRNTTKPIEIRSTYILTKDEVESLTSGGFDLQRSVAMGRMGQLFSQPAALVQILNSFQGGAEMKRAGEDLSAELARLTLKPTLTLGLTIDPNGNIIPADNLSGYLIGYLDRRLPPDKTIFSYFPADRALPFGEGQIQIGAADSQQLVESHNSSPQTKYNRMKSLVYNTIVKGEKYRSEILGEFEKIFSGILRGRRVKTIGVNELGLLSIITEDIATGRPVEIDNLSSGEKNLLLTFLLIANSIQNGGIALFDEPELHLNPAVCKEVLEFMMTQYAQPQDLQFIICTHSPEMLAGAFSGEECSLYHVKSEVMVSKIAREALDEYSDALQKLGTSVSESLLYEGTILVEGDDDVLFLETGFKDLLKKYKVKDRGGRREVEKVAKQIQSLETQGSKVSPIFIIFDKDEEPTDLASSESVRIMQWERRCIENYLIDIEVITHLLKQKEFAREPVSSQGEVDKLLRELALSQIDSIVAREVYASYGYKNPTLWAADVLNKPLEAVARSLYDRLTSVKGSLDFAEKSVWEQDFLMKCAVARGKIMMDWEVSWKEVCDGKRLFDDLQKTGLLKKPNSIFKLRIVQEMRLAKSENWRLVESLLKVLLGTTAS